MTQSNTSPAEVPPLPFVSALADIPTTMPAFARAHAISSRAYEAGFRWETAKQAAGKIGEEWDEVKLAVAKQDRPNTIEEIGDMLSAIVTLAVFIKMDKAVLSNVTVASVHRGEADLRDAVDKSVANVDTAITDGNEEHIRRAIRQLLDDIATFAASKGIDHEKALQQTNDKFTYRFEETEKKLHARGFSMGEETPFKEKLKAWVDSKLEIRAAIQL